jgi:hypothetical protein
MLIGIDMKKDEKAIAVAEGITTALSGLSASGLEVNTDVRALITEECKKAGVTLERLCKTMDEGLKATKGTLDKFGEMHTEDDFLTRHKFMVTALELMGYLKQKSDGGVNVNVINMSMGEQEELDTLRRNIYEV